jgi:hypothetical protein
VGRVPGIVLCALIFHQKTEKQHIAKHIITQPTTTPLTSSTIIRTIIDFHHQKSIDSSMGAMEDIQSSRRRRKSIPVGEQIPPLLVPSASDDKDGTGSTSSGHDEYSKKTNQQSHSQKQPKKSSNNNSNSNRANQRRKRKSPRPKEEPFWFLTLQVGTALLVLCLATFHLHQWLWPDSTLFSRVEQESSSSTYDDDTGAQGASEQEEQLNALLDAASEQERIDLQKLQLANEKLEVTLATPPPQPVFELSKASKYDAFGIVQELTAPEHNNPDFWRVSNGLKRRFAATYGGENAARMLLDRGLSTFVESGSHSGIPSDILQTACRMHEARQEKRPFRMAFGGYSVTAGRGNHFSQSFPFVMEDLLHTAFRQAGLDLTVRNAAIGGVPAFPYGWCMTNFWGDQPDVVSWDYSMNEAGGVPQGIEAYVRHILTQFPATQRPPKLIVKDTHMATQRRDLLLQYIGLLKDPVVLHTDPAVQPFLSREEQHRPLGFQEWRKFGAPLGAPGQALHHPAIKEHELIGWMLAMHFLSALEVLVASSSANPLECSSSSNSDTNHGTTLPHPISGELTNTTMEYPSILFGMPSKDKIISKQQPEQWSMNPVRCRTSFQPLLEGNLTSIVVDGSTAENIDLLLPKSMMFYSKGWTMDLSEGEKAAKRKLGLYDKGLGFVDGKEAYYGLINSGPLRLLLPYDQPLPKEGPHRDEAVREQQHPKVGDVATDWFVSVVVCQVNEKRDAGSCNSATDMGYRVGGFNATNATLMRDTGTLFLGKKLCTHMSIPRKAKLTSRLEIFLNEQKKKVDDEGSIFLPEEDSIVAKNEVGLLVEVFVTNHHMVHVQQACSVSHVVWEQQPSAPTKDKSAAIAGEKRVEWLS